MANYILIPWLFAFPSSPYPRLPSQDSPTPLDTTISRLPEVSDESPAFGFLPIIWTNMNVRALLYLVPFNVSLGMLCWCYYLTMTTDPGSPPLDWNPPIDGSSIEYKRTTHTPRYCRTCDAYKPPRTHHCRTCKKCVLKMDHHCPWVRNCIGFFNYGHFVRFIFWTTITTSICAALIVLRSLEAYENEQLGINSQSAPSSEQIIVIIVCLCLDGPVLFGVSVLSIYHIWCISSNTTTIESWEKDRVLTMIRRGKIRDVKCPYHQGILTNFQEVLGKNPLLWLWPQPMIGDGLRFKVKHEKNDLYDPRSSEDEAPSSSSSSSAISKPWFRPFDSGPHQRDELVEMV
ncbi:Palmitoyltransferase [Mortierella alpina]|nr:Palmitoyltransferase [Mortierella alpina]